MAGMSLRDLVASTGDAVSHTAIDRYESGVMLPDSAILSKMATALKQPIDFFFRPLGVKLEGISFRKQSALGKKAEASLREFAADAVERLIEIEELSATAHPFKNPLGKIKISTLDDAEKAAETLRKVWELGSDAIPSVVELLERKGIKVVEIEAPPTFSGLSAWANKDVPVIVLASWMENKSVARKRLTALHELAHLLLDDLIPETLPRKERESIMDRFAGAVLIPQSTFREEFGAHRSSVFVSELIPLKCAYGISIAAIVKRAQQLGCISDSAYKWFQIRNKTQTWKTNGEPGDERYRGNEQCRRLEQLVLRALAEEQISQSKAAALLGKRVGDLWAEWKVEA